jgi:hypothetical protein
MTQTEDHMAEATIVALANLATATAADRGVVAALTQANAGLVKLESFAPSGTALQAGPNKCQRNCKQLLLDSWLQGGQESHKPHLHHSQPGPQNGGNSG